VYVSTFFTLSPQGVRIVFTSMADFFAGAVIPLPFFPPKWQRVLELLPFASMQNVPLRVYSGSMTGAETERAVALQVIWLAVLVLLGSGLCRAAEKKATIQGG
ncbi:MAG: ABC-2 family transporter protein, partial [Lachnospiraceae bacterium]|nr:ABC-2 family transporter protein [Lachnospiraceae bacterium]